MRRTVSLTGSRSATYLTRRLSADTELLRRRLASFDDAAQLSDDRIVGQAAHTASRQQAALVTDRASESRRATTPMARFVVIGWIGTEVAKALFAERVTAAERLGKTQLIEAKVTDEQFN